MCQQVSHLVCFGKEFKFTEHKANHETFACRTGFFFISPTTWAKGLGVDMLFFIEPTQLLVTLNIIHGYDCTYEVNTVLPSITIKLASDSLGSCDILMESC